MVNKVRVLPYAVLVLLIQGCMSTGEPALGETVTIAPGWDQLKKSGKQAFQDPHVWAPLLGALLLQVDNLDEEISDQLREHTPIFGTAQNAAEASDDLLLVTEVGYVTTALLAPGPEDPSKWLSTKVKLIGSEWIATETASGVTRNLKSLSERERPSGQNNRSFPSGHATNASIQAQMANLNVAYLPIHESSKQTLRWSFYSFAALTAWARVEAGAHYPADALAGWAIGHYVGNLAQAFIIPDHPNVLIRPSFSSDDSKIDVLFRF